MKRFFLAILGLCVAAAVYVTLRPAPDYISAGRFSGAVISHKTAGLEFPENTVEGFVASLAMPDVAAIELDVHVVKDGGVVLHHDPVLSDYNCFEKGDPTRVYLAQQTVEDLLAFDCMNHKVGARYKITTLDRFLEIYRSTDQSKKLLLEIKVWDDQIEHNPLHDGLDTSLMHYPDADVAQTVYTVLRRYPDVHNIQFNTFGRNLLLELKAKKTPDEQFDFGLLYKGAYEPRYLQWVAWLSGFGCHAFCWVPDYAEARTWLDTHGITTFIPHFVQATSLPYRRGFQAHIMTERGDLTVIPWTLNTPKDWSAFEPLGFDGILTDLPTSFVAWNARTSASEQR